MYTQQDLIQALAQLKRRRLTGYLPSAVGLAAAIAVFVAGRMQRSDSAWVISTALTILAVGYFLFLYGVSIKPAKTYCVFLQDMLTGRKRETQGVFKSFSADVCDRDGLPCHSLLLNVGQKDDPQDDRQFYWDAQMPNPAIALGAQVKVESNDNRIASMTALE